MLSSDVVNFWLTHIMGTRKKNYKKYTVCKKSLERSFAFENWKLYRSPFIRRWANACIIRFKIVVIYMSLHVKYLNIKIRLYPEDSMTWGFMDIKLIFKTLSAIFKLTFWFWEKLYQICNAMTQSFRSFLKNSSVIGFAILNLGKMISNQ